MWWAFCMQIISIISSLLFISSAFYIFTDWKIGLLLFFIATAVHIFPQGPDKFLRHIAGGLVIGGVISLFINWKVGLLLFFLTYLVTKYRLYGNRVYEERYGISQDSHELLKDLFSKQWWGGHYDPEWEEFIQLQRSSEEGTKVIELLREFPIRDDLDFKKYIANSLILEHGSRALYKKFAKLSDDPDYSEQGSATIDFFASKFDRPLGYGKWFIAGYPDVVKWFSDLDESEVKRALGSPSKEDFLEHDRYIKNKYLKRMIKVFKAEGHSLECSR
jgi:hypothetical protein